MDWGRTEQALKRKSYPSLIRLVFWGDWAFSELVCLMNWWAPGNPNLLGLDKPHVGLVYHLVPELGPILRRCEWWGRPPLLPNGKDRIGPISPIVVGRRLCEPQNYPTLFNLGGENHLKMESHPSPIKLPMRFNSNFWFLLFIPYATKNQKTIMLS
jgi:hypothetical protein